MSTSLRKAFHKMMKSRLPDFQKAGTDFGGILYRKRDIEAKRYIFVLFYPDPKFDRFTIELASNDGPQFPFQLLPGDQVEGASRVRIRKFLPKGHDGWWNLTSSHEVDIKRFQESLEDVEGGLVRMPAAVEDAMEQLRSALRAFVHSLN
ncbi:MAG: hypothetical protein HY234_01565 [Acidobacteria bacterium]|nr:hypothetical protein [Acidobacteriota bacterium]